MDDVARVKSQLDAVALISSYVPLKGAGGGQYKGQCPFHEDRSPSFSVRDDGLFYCFGCGARGDVLGFIEQIEGVPFPEALRRAAEFAGVELSAARREAGPQVPYQAGLDILDRARTYFHRLLLESSKADHARAALEARKLPTEVWEDFAIGYAWGAESDWTGLVRKKGWDLELSERVGLTGGGGRDRFRDRIMFPIRDERGRTVGFGGRRLDESVPAKYINSPDSPWFHKGQVLFGLHRAQDHWKTERRAVLCEGYTDVIRLHSIGVRGAVAPLGTALTTRQAGRIGARVRTVVLAFDADDAGRKAALAAWTHLHPRGVEVRWLDMPEGEDPDTLVHTLGAEAVRELVDTAPLFWSTYLERHIAGASDTAEKRRALDEVVGRLAELENPVDADLLAEEAAAASGVRVKSLREQIERQRRPTPASRRPRARRSEMGGRPRGTEGMLVRYLLHHPDQRFELEERLGELALHPWVKAALTGRQPEDPGYRQWLADEAFAEAPHVDREALISEIEELARERSRRSEMQRLEARHEELRQAGRMDEAREVARELDRMRAGNGDRKEP